MADTKHIITCPACDKEMKKVFIKDSNINVDICLDGCGGILFDNRELEKFDEEHENADEIFEAIKDKTYTPVDEREVRICPICNIPMVKHGSGIEGVEIDVCNVCGAKFLDKGELEKIRNCADNTNYKNNIDSEVNLYALENEYKPAGVVGDVIRRIIPSTGGRDAFVSFLNFLSNK